MTSAFCPQTCIGDPLTGTVAEHAQNLITDRQQTQVAISVFDILLLINHISSRHGFSKLYFRGGLIVQTKDAATATSKNRFDDRITIQIAKMFHRGTDGLTDQGSGYRHVVGSNQFQAEIFVNTGFDSPSRVDNHDGSLLLQSGQPIHSENHLLQTGGRHCPRDDAIELAGIVIIDDKHRSAAAVNADAGIIVAAGCDSLAGSRSPLQIRHMPTIVAVENDQLQSFFQSNEAFNRSKRSAPVVTDRPVFKQFKDVLAGLNSIRSTR